MIVFVDLDGPILDVSPRYCQLHRELLTPLGFDGMDAERYWARPRPYARAVGGGRLRRPVPAPH